METIPVHIINLKKRVERKAHVLNEFSKHQEFEAIIIEAIECSEGAVGLWMTIVKILQEGRLFRDSCIVICEDDHEFTGEYSFDLLLSAIDYVTEKKGDVLFAGVSWFNNAVPVTEHIYWVEKSSGTQFMIIFKEFFSAIINAPFRDYDSADTKISVLTDKKYFISPFLSIQKEFGYSDVTPRNSVLGRVDALFDNSVRKTRVIKYLYKFYENPPLRQLSETGTQAGRLQVFIITQSGEEKSGYEDHFNRNEFLVDHIISPYESVIYPANLKKAVEMAYERNQDTIIVCRNDVRFTQFFSTVDLFGNISLAHKLSAEVLIGGAQDFEIAVPVTENLFWINFFFNAPLVVIFKNAFDKILNFRPANTAMEELDIAAALSNKLLLYPYIVDFNRINEDEPNYTRLSLMTHKKPSERLDLIKVHAQL
ncbi:hypothetical protein SNE26_07275 [Mucilaginibacter sp. cycad4]|uniref:hypothetical protein n=1 Tax=Mucilaginibacter sp. cycad4 TaxID=3342096 RepID=UPI002AAABCEF|nr:hypothetical protein [Mucilaginibacter gossypii]WPV01573.1 hypothetical protein SNE26_07275 [Mucilaginibacter gossypii]